MKTARKHIVVTALADLCRLLNITKINSAAETKSDPHSMKMSVTNFAADAKALQECFGVADTEKHVLEELSKWLDASDALVSVMAGDAGALAESDSKSLIELGSMVLIKRYVGESHVADLMTLYKTQIFPHVALSLTEELKPMLDKLRTHSKEMLLSLESKETMLAAAALEPMEMLSQDTLESLKGKLQSLGLQGLHNKVEFVVRLHKYVEKVRSLLSSPCCAIDEPTLKIVCEMSKASLHMDWFTTAHDKDMHHVGLGHTSFPDVIDAPAVCATVRGYEKLAVDDMEKKFTALIKTTLDEFAAMMPDESLFSEATLLTDAALQSRIVDNPEHDKLAPMTTKCLKMFELLKSAGLLKAVRKTISSHVQCLGTTLQVFYFFAFF